MKSYILNRVLKSFISIFLVVSIVMVMAFTMIPRTNIFMNDGAYSKLSGDAKTTYMYTKLDELGYLEFVRQVDMCAVAGNPDKCNNNDPAELDAVIAQYEANGYVVSKLNSGTVYGYHDYSIAEILLHFWTNLIQIDTPSYVEKHYGVKLENTGYRFGTDYAGVPALIGNGTN